MPKAKKMKSNKANELMSYLFKWVLNDDQGSFEEFKSGCKLDESIYTQEKLHELGLYKNGLNEFKNCTADELTALSFHGSKYAAAERLIKYYNKQKSFKRSSSSYSGVIGKTSHIDKKIKQIKGAVARLDTPQLQGNDTDGCNVSSSYKGKKELNPATIDQEIKPTIEELDKKQSQDDYPDGWNLSSVYNGEKLNTGKIAQIQQMTGAVARLDTPQLQGNCPDGWRLPDGYSLFDDCFNLCCYADSTEATTEWFESNNKPGNKMTVADDEQLVCKQPSFKTFPLG